MKTVLGHVNDRTAAQPMSVRWTARLVVVALATALVVGWMVLMGPSADAHAATAQTGLQAEGCYANNAGCANTHGEEGQAEYEFYKCAGAAAIGGIFSGWGGAATGGFGCAWVSAW